MREREKERERDREREREGARWGELDLGKTEREIKWEERNMRVEGKSDRKKEN